MHEFRTLAILSKCKRLFERAGIDYNAMETILRIKLTMDGRRTPTIFNGQKKKEGNQFLKSLWIYGIYGLMVIPFLLLRDGHYIFQMSIVFGIIMFILTTTMVSDFSSVLLDVRDKTILQTKPVSSRTLGTAKTIHILIYMFFIAGAFIGIPLVVGLFAKGILFTLVFLAALVLTMLFIVVITSLVYFAVLRFFDGEKLKDIINYVQILLSVGVIVGYQVVIRAFDFVDIDLTYTFSWWHVFLPPMWFGAAFELLLNQDFSKVLILLATLALLVPLISMFIYVRLMPSFERNMDKLMSESKNRKKKTSWWVDSWAKLCCRNKEERTFFRFGALMMQQERDFKLKVYPSLGFAMVFPFIFIFTELQMRTLAEISTGKLFLFIYFGSLMIPSIIHTMQFSVNHKGSWLFRAAPIQQPAAAYSGTLKAFLVKLYMPVFVLLSIAFITIFSWRIVPDLFAVLLGAILQTLLTYKWLNSGEFPFTESFEFAQSEGSAKMILITFSTGIFVIGHLIATAIRGGIYVYIAVLLIGVFLGWRKVFPMQETIPVRG
ncbi:hypothetical protein M3193_10820 [Sporosarcina luteola]|uniref:hypothetical protein n=1 Tax=Sporosarcina luteola TaxID=582850 RepID=UPI00203D0DDF|nr:hypothetical protein [Sporosarcina luteola]MCM3744638.1 hypothetical protein [Sporosarcina luteola]